jgi:hypothetical protein
MRGAAVEEGCSAVPQYESERVSECWTAAVAGVSDAVEEST